MRNRQALINLAYESSILYAKDFPGEPFHKDYTDNPDIFRRLIKSDRMLEKRFRTYFKDLAARMETEIDWMSYESRLKKASEIDDWIKVDWEGEALNIRVILTDALLDAIVAGGLKMQEDSGIDIGWNGKAPSVIDFLNEYGLKLAKGLNKTTAEKIKKTLALSIENGEMTTTAANRLAEILDDPQRAATIARTESVRAFGAGRRAVADELGWQWKEWHTTISPCEICAPLPNYGRIAIDAKFAGEFDSEPAHPNCRCSVRYYKEER